MLPENPALRRNINLDVLRGIALILVLFNHWDLYANSFFLAPLLKLIQGFGWIGVDLFFVLSGFLVSGLFFYEFKKNKDLRIKRFLLRRAFKIYPSFYFLMAITVMYYFVTHKNIETGSLWAELLFFQNYHKGIWDHTWSLAIEEHFYLLLPLLLFFLLRKNKFELYPKVVFCILILVFCTRIISFWLLGSLDNLDARFPTHLRIDSLFFGSLLSYYMAFNTPFQTFIETNKKRILSGSLLAIIVLMVLASDLKNPTQATFMYTIGFTLLYFLFGAFVVSFIRIDAMKLNIALRYVFSFLAWIGISSYPIYLMHLAVKFWGVDIVQLILRGFYNDFIATISYFILSIFVGKALGELIEKPFLRLREKLNP